MITYIPKIHKTALAIGMWQLNGWEALLLQFIFPYILTVKERYNPLDYFCMGIIEEISLFFFDMEDPVGNQNFVRK